MMDISADDLLYEAWAVIANAGWDGADKSEGWQEAAVRWRDKWHAYLEDSRPDLDLAEAARSVLDAPRIWWCEVYWEAWFGPRTACVYSPTQHSKCRWVRLVADPQEHAHAELLGESTADFEAERLILNATELILGLMEHEGLTRSELAERIGKSKGHVSQLLNGERNMTLRTLAEIAHAVGHRIELGARSLASRATTHDADAEEE